MVSIKWLKLKTKYTVMDMRKGRSGRKVRVRTASNIAALGRLLQRAAIRKPSKPGPSAWRHSELISKSSYNRITKIYLKLKP